MSSRVTRASNKTSHPGRLLDLVPRNETEPINLDAVAAVEDRAAQRKADRRKDTQQRAFKPTAKEPATLPNPVRTQVDCCIAPSGPVYASQTSSDAAQEYSQVAQGRSEVAQERGEFDAQRFPERPVTRAPAQDRQRQEYVVPRVGTRDVDEVGPSLREDEGGYAPAGLDPADGEDGENLFAGGYEGAEVEDVSEMGSRELVVDRATAPPSSGDEYFEDDYYAAGYIDNDGDDSSADPDYDANEEEEGHEEEDEEVDEEDEGAEEGDVIARAPKKGKAKATAPPRGSIRAQISQRRLPASTTVIPASKPGQFTSAAKRKVPHEPGETTEYNGHSLEEAREGPRPAAKKTRRTFEVGLSRNWKELRPPTTPGVARQSNNNVMQPTPSRAPTGSLPPRQRIAASAHLPSRPSSSRPTSAMSMNSSSCPPSSMSNRPASSLSTHRPPSSMSIRSETRPDSRMSSASSHFDSIPPDEVRDTEYRASTASTTSVKSASRSTAQMGIKLEAAESRLPTRPRKRRGESATPKFTNANLPDCCRGDSRWKNTFIPTITLRTGTMTVPWDLTARDDTLDFISSVFEQVFGHDTGEVIDHKCAVYLVTVQRQVEYRGKFGEVALDVLQEFFETTKDPEALRQNPRATKLLYPTQASRQQYVKRALNGLCCFYAHPDYDDPSESTGIFRSHFVLATLAHHYRATEGALEEALRADLDVAANEMTPPSGALALAAVAVERAFQHYTSGERAKQVQAFSEGKCRSATEVYAEKIDQVDYDTWMEIIEGARAVADGETGAEDVKVIAEQVNNQRLQLRVR